MRKALATLLAIALVVVGQPGRVPSPREALSQADAQSVGSTLVNYTPSGGPYAATANPGFAQLAANNFVDNTGNRWSVDASNYLQSPSLNNYSGVLVDSPAYGSSSVSSSSTVATFVMGSSSYFALLARLSLGGSRGGVATGEEAGVSTTGIQINAYTNGGANDTSLATENITLTAGTTYKIKMDVTGSTITEKLFAADGVTQVGTTLTATDTTANATAVGYNAIHFYAPNGTSGVKTVAIYNSVQPDSVIGSTATPAPSPTPTATPNVALPFSLAITGGPLSAAGSPGLAQLAGVGLNDEQGQYYVDSTNHLSSNAGSGAYAGLIVDSGVSNGAPANSTVTLSYSQPSTLSISPRTFSRLSGAFANATALTGYACAPSSASALRIYTEASGTETQVATSPNFTIPTGDNLEIKMDTTGSPATVTCKMWDTSFTTPTVIASATFTDTGGPASGNLAIREYNYTAPAAGYGITGIAMYGSVQPDSIVVSNGTNPTPTPTASPTATPVPTTTPVPIAPAFATVPVTVLTPGPNAAATAYPGAAQFQPAGWSDYGSNWSVASGSFQQATQSGFGTGPMIDDNVLGGIPTYLRDTTTVVQFIVGAPSMTILARVQPPITAGVARMAYQIVLQNSGTSTTQISVQSRNLGTFNQVGYSGNFTTVTGHSLTMKADVYGANPTTITAKVFDGSASNALLGSVTLYDSAGPQGKGNNGFTFYAPDNSHGVQAAVVWNQIQVDSQAFEPINSATPPPVPAPTPVATCASAPCTATPAPSPSIGAAVTPLPVLSPAAVVGVNGAQGWLTTSSSSSLAAPIAAASFTPGTAGSDTTITVTNTQNQPIDGMGTLVQYWGGLETFEEMPLALQGPMMKALFAPTNGVMQLDMLRIPIAEGGPSYTYDDQPPGFTDTNFSGFSLAKDDAIGITSFLQQAVGLNPNLRILGSPGSPPAFLKTPQSLYGTFQGTNTAFSGTASNYAPYFVDFVQAEAARGIPIWGITPQNEPNYNYGTNGESTFMSESQLAALSTAICSAFTTAGYGNVKVLGLDNDWNFSSEANQLLTDAPCIAGIGWHWYGPSGTEGSAMQSVATAHPGIPQWMTEGQAFAPGGTSTSDTLSNMAPIIITDFNTTGRAWMYYGILATPVNGEPSLAAKQADGLFNVNWLTGAATMTPEGAIVASFNHSVTQDAHQLTTSSSRTTVQVAGFVNNDANKTRAVILYNGDSSAHTVAIVDAGGYSVSTSIAAGAFATVRYGNLTSTAVSQPPSIARPVRRF